MSSSSHANPPWCVGNLSTNPQLYRMIPIPEAQRIVMDCTSTLPSVTLPLIEALGRTLASPVVARDSLPPFPASIKVGRRQPGIRPETAWHEAGDSLA